MGTQKERDPHRIPKFYANDLYVYFDSLKEGGATPYLAAMKAKVYSQAQTHFSQNVYEHLNDGNSRTIQSALKFLENVAFHERSKEIKLLENYIKEIEAAIPEELREGKEMAEIIKGLKETSKELRFRPGGDEFSQDIAANMKGKLDNFYRDLTKYINIVKQSYDEFQDRIQQLLDDGIDSRRQLAARSFLYRVDGDIESALNDSIGTAARKEADSFSSMISETIMDYLSKGLINNVNIQENFHAILSGMIVDFEYFLQQDKAKNGYATLDEPYHKQGARARLEKMFNQYLTDSNTFFSQEMRNTSQSGELSAGFKAALDNFGNRIGLGFMSDAKDIAARQQKLDKQADNMSQIAKHGQRNYIAKKLDELNLTTIRDINKYIKIVAKSNQRHGTLNEAVQTIIYGGFSTQGHPATDIVEIGQILMKIDDQKLRDDITILLQEIAEEIKKTGEQNRKSRRDNYVRELQEANAAIKRKTQQIYDKLKPLLKQEKKELFIYHESLKLYSEMEQSNGSGQELKRKASKFEGRDLNAMNTIDLLYSMETDNKNGVELLGRNALAGAMLNMSKGTVGYSQRGAITNYLQMFVGMIMFSDITNMAEEIGVNAQKTISNSDATHIHLYSLNGTYVPGSMVLTYIYSAMTKLASNIDIKSFARVSISTNAAEAEINKYEADRKSGIKKHEEKDWAEMAEKVSKGTKVKVNFMGDFLNLIQSIGSVI